MGGWEVGKEGRREGERHIDYNKKMFRTHCFMCVDEIKKMQTRCITFSTFLSMHMYPTRVHVKTSSQSIVWQRWHPVPYWSTNHIWIWTWLEVKRLKPGTMMGLSSMREHFQYIFYGDDHLWDGAGCGEYSTCCDWNSPPWFRKKISPPTSDDIEMSLYTDQNENDESVNFEILELYVQWFSWQLHNLSMTKQQVCASAFSTHCGELGTVLCWGCWA